MSGTADSSATATVPNRTETVAEWLENLDPTPPPVLLVRLRELLAANLTRPASETPAVCLEASMAQLHTMLSARATDRGSALDLLAVDALVTYAFEDASTTPKVLESLARDAMVRIAAIPEAP